MRFKFSKLRQSIICFLNIIRQFFQPFSGLTKLVVAGGGDQPYGRLKSVEVVNLDESNPSVTCKNLPDLPLGLWGAMGQLYQQKTPIICGGGNGADYRSDCHSLENGTWIEIASLNVPRYWSASATFFQGEDEILLMTGGKNENEILSTVQSFDGKTWNHERISDLPESVLLHCLVKINNSMLFQIGGYTTTETGNTYFFDINENKWLPGPNLKEPRKFQSCGVLNWINPETETEEKVVVVAGGEQGSFSRVKVELLFLNDLKTGWVFGPSLLGERKIYDSRMIEFENSVILIGGGYEEVDGKNLYQLSSPNGRWTQMRQTLKEGRMSHVAFLIPDELVDCQ